MGATIDEGTLAHLKNWADWELYDDERDAVIARILEFIAENPDYIERGYSWPEIRERAESE